MYIDIYIYMIIKYNIYIYIYISISWRIDPYHLHPHHYILSDLVWQPDYESSQVGAQW